MMKHPVSISTGLLTATAPASSAKKTANSFLPRWKAPGLSGESRPSVWVPLGDFFGTAAGKPVKNDYTLKDDRIEITLKKKLVLSENQTLDVTIQQQDK